MNTTESEAKQALDMSADILANFQDWNTVLTQSQIVRAVFHTHYVNMQADSFGIESLIADILKENGAFFPQNSENGALSNVVESVSMTSRQIFAKVQEKFAAGSIRYPYQTIKDYLSTIMFQKGLIGKIKKSSKVGFPCLWYLVSNPPSNA